MAYYSFSLSAKKTISIWFCVFVAIINIIGTANSSDNPNCPFDFLFHLGDGAFDVGNSIRRFPSGPNLPADKLPYGETTYTTSEGRWSDGYLDLDYGGAALGFPELKASLANDAKTGNGVIFAVARSPVLDRNFFGDKVKFPQYVAPLSVQLSWFKQYLGSIGRTKEDRADVLGNSLFLMGDVEANDIAFPLIQGTSIKDAQSYVSHVTEAQINAAKEVIEMGATRVIFTGNVPLGCYPYILTKLGTTNPNDYDGLGCLKSINNLVKYKNKDLQDGIDKLKKEYPKLFIYYADFYGAVFKIIKDAQSQDCGGSGDFLKSCCGTGGKYNYNASMFCGTSGVPVCSDPSKYVFWDGINLTDETNYLIAENLRKQPMKELNCKSQTWSKALKPKKKLAVNVGGRNDEYYSGKFSTMTKTIWFGIESSRNNIVVAFVVAIVGIVAFHKRISSVDQLVWGRK